MANESSVKVSNCVAAMRHRCGMTATELASRAGVTRQAIHALETGGYVPNTVVALRIAKALRTTVDRLFELDDEPTAVRTEEVRLLPGGGCEPGLPVQIAKVNGHFTAVAVSPVACFLPAGDGVLLGESSAQLFDAEGGFEDRVLLAGCDPGMGVLAKHLGAVGEGLVLAHRNSAVSLQLVAEGLAHIGGMHWRSDEGEPDPNVDAAKRYSPDGELAVISYATWVEGLCVTPGNPKGIRSVADLVRPGIRLINREPGAGTRVLLDRHLAKMGIGTELVVGYQTAVRGHLPAAWHVHSGNADVCIATEAAARAFRLDFIPISESRYDLAVWKATLKTSGVQRVFDTLTRGEFRRQLETLGGYDTRVAGQRVL